MRRQKFSKSISKKGGSGFTLLELLVVLVLMGLLASVVLPRMSLLYEKTMASFELEDIRLALARIPLQTYLSNSSYELKELPSLDKTLMPIQIPDGWRVTAEHPIIYQSNGICLGGVVSAQYGNVQYQLVLNAPRCIPEL